MKPEEGKCGAPAIGAFGLNHGFHSTSNVPVTQINLKY